MHDPFDGQTPQPMQPMERGGFHIPIHRGLPLEEEHSPANPQGLRPQFNATFEKPRPAADRGRHQLNDWKKKRAQVGQEIEIRESQIQIKVKTLVRLQADLNRLNATLSGLRTPSAGQMESPTRVSVRAEAGRIKHWVETTRAELAAFSAELKDLKRISVQVEEHLIAKNSARGATRSNSPALARPLPPPLTSPRSPLVPNPGRNTPRDAPVSPRGPGPERQRDMR